MLAGAIKPRLRAWRPSPSPPVPAVKWIPQGWQWVDRKVQGNAAGHPRRADEPLGSHFRQRLRRRDVDREIAADNQRADDLGLIFDSDPRRTSKDGGSAEPNRTLRTDDTTVSCKTGPQPSAWGPHDPACPFGGTPVRVPLAIHRPNWT